MNVIRFLAAAALAVLLHSQTVPPTVLQKVEPEYGPSQRALVIDPTQVEMTVDADGAVAALKSSTGLPDNVVQALRRWRFTPGAKNGKREWFAMNVIVPLKRPIDQYLRSSEAPHSPDQRVPANTYRNAAALDAEKAASVERKLKDDAESADARMELLIYAASKPDAASLAMRNRQLAWLVRNRPDAEILGSPGALIDPHRRQGSGDYETVRALWLEQVKNHPNNPLILYHAAYFLQVSDPAKAEELLTPAIEKVGGAAAWLGRVYAYGALGVNRLDPEHGAPGIDPERLTTAYAKHATSMLAGTQDARILAAALATISRAGKALAESGNPTADYLDLCRDLLTRVKTLDPDTTQSCVVPPSPAPEKRPGVTVTAARLKTRVSPIYPPGARSRRIQGAARFDAVIAKDGTVQDLELIEAPLILYDAARAALLQWIYEPTMLDGRPVEVHTRLDVNFSLTQ